MSSTLRYGGGSSMTGTSATEPGALTPSYDSPVRGPVLLATDGQSATDATMRAAQEIGWRLGATVEVVGVLEPFPSYSMAPSALTLPPDIEAGRRMAVRTAIDARLAALAGGAERWPVELRDGQAGPTIAARARERDATMIVVGAGRHERRNRIFGGERAIRVLRAADRPVMMVPADFTALPTTVVVGMDFSPASVRAARAALFLLGDGGRLVLVHVTPLISLPTVPPTFMLSDTRFEPLVARWREDEAASTARLFERLRDDLRPSTPSGVTIETRSRTGDVREELLDVAAETGAGMLAVGTQGATALERLLMGSVATDIVRHAGRAVVLVAPPPPAVEAARIELRLRGTTEMMRPADWGPALDAFTKRNAGRPVRIEVDDPEIGAQMQEHGYALLGVAYDPHDRCIEIMVGNATDRVQHLTRSIPHADDVAFYANNGGQERAMRVARGRAQTILTFQD
jgi:nucleotide-binding universal stress UspA family protein